MKKYRHLLEELTPEQKSLVDSYGKPIAAKKISSHVMKSDTIFMPLEHGHDEGHEIHPEVAAHLEKHGIKIPSVQEYKSGYGVDKYNRITSIGKALKKTKAPEETLKAFEHDPVRAAGNSEHMVAITHNPYHVAGMSTDRGWTSCVNMEKGCNAHHIEHDIAQGTHVAYLVHKHDTEIKNPIARIALKPFSHTSATGETHTIIHPENETYGTANSKFKNTVSNWAQTHFKPKEDTQYTKHPDVYDDSGSSLWHPSEKSIHSVVTQGNHSGVDALLDTSRHHIINQKAYDVAKSGNNMDVMHHIAAHSYSSPDLVNSHIGSLSQPEMHDFLNTDIKYNPEKISGKHVNKIIEAGFGDTKKNKEFYRHPEISSKNVSRVIDSDINHLSLVHSPAIKSEHIHQVLDSPNLDQLKSHNTLATSPNINKSHTDKIVDIATKTDNGNLFRALPVGKNHFKNIDDVRKFHAHFGNDRQDIVNHLSNHPELSTTDVDNIAKHDTDSSNSVHRNILVSHNPKIVEHALGNAQFVKNIAPADLYWLHQHNHQPFVANHYMNDKTPPEHLGTRNSPVLSTNMIEHSNKSKIANEKRDNIMTNNAGDHHQARHQALNSALAHGKAIGNNELFNKHAVDYAERYGNIAKEHFAALPKTHQEKVLKNNIGVL